MKLALLNRAICKEVSNFKKFLEGQIIYNFLLLKTKKTFHFRQSKLS
jgi:hypothetical protein